MPLKRRSNVVQRLLKGTSSIRQPGTQTVGVGSVKLQISLDSSAASQTQVKPGTKKKEEALPRDAWYPIVVKSDIGPKPKSLRVLGEDLVVWRHKTEDTDTVSVMQDRCPHRLVPLSEGHVDVTTGCIECPLHGWQFAADGTNTCIPASPENPPQAPYRKDTVTYPTQEVGDMVWAYLGPDPVADPLAPPAPYATPPTELYPFLAESRPTKTFVRELPVDVTVVLENFFDPAHIPFAHHGKQGKREDARAPLELGKIRDDDPRHLSVEFSDVTGGTARTGTLNFKPPVGFWFDTESVETNRKGGLGLLCVPVEPGVTRVFIVLLHIPRKITDKIPAFLLHIASNGFLDTDTYLLNQQALRVRQGAGGLGEGQMPPAADVLKQYHFGSPADKAPMAFHSWFKKYFNSKVPYAEDMIPMHPMVMHRSQILDRGWQHTDHCASCSTARKRLPPIKLAVAAVCACAAFLLRTRPLIAGGFGVLAALLWKGLSMLQTQLGFADYVHSDSKAKITTPLNLGHPPLVE